ncbi:MAG: Bax inhibitor-1/YccA family membrane protein [Actinomycetota bacterium]
MQSHNPVLSRAFEQPRSRYESPTPSAEQLEQMYQAPPAGPRETGRMTYDDVVAKGGMMFAVLLVGAVVGWQMPQLAWVGLIVGLVLALVNIFKREPSPALILAYAGFEGLFLGGISVILESYTPSSIVPQAVLGTMGVFAVSLWLFKSGRIRVTSKFRRGVLIALGGYMVFVLVNFVATMFGAGGTFGFRSGGLGIAIGLFAIALAALVLILDFDFIEKGVQAGIPEKYAWTAAFGLTVTLVWLYIEMLRLLAILQGE